jgi:choice-of-anchor A domain-containing protein
MRRTVVGKGLTRGFVPTIAIMMGVIALGFMGATGAWAGTPLGPDAQLFGLLSTGGSITLAHSSTVSDVSQAPAPPEVGATSDVDIAGPTSYLTGDLIVSSAGTPAISLGAHDTVVGECVTSGPPGVSISLGLGASCGSTSTDGSSLLLDTLEAASAEAPDYSAYLAGLTTTNDLGDITLKKYQSFTVKLTLPVNVVAIDSITTAGGNTITLSAPKGAVVVINVTGSLNLGTGTQVFDSNGLNPHNLVWNIQSANPTFGSNVTLSGTVINFTPDQATLTDVTFGAGSSLNGAVLAQDDIIAVGALHLNFWPFTAAPGNPIGGCVVTHGKFSPDC